jgi:hypothetical protein
MIGEGETKKECRILVEKRLALSLGVQRTRETIQRFSSDLWRCVTGLAETWY